MEKQGTFTGKINKIMLICAFILITLLSLASAFSPFSMSQSPVATNVFAFVFVPVVFFVGYYIKQRKLVEMKDILLFVGAAFALVTLVNTIATFVNYGLLHLIVWEDTPIYYFEGMPYDITKEAIGLVNFSLKIVSPEYAATTAVLAGTFVPGAFFLDRNKDKVRFVFALTIGGVGVLSLLTIGNWKALVVLALVVAFAFVYKLLWKNAKVIRIIKYVIWGLIALAILFYIIAGINALSGFVFSGFFEKVFETNAIMNKVSDVLGGIFIKDGANGLINFFGLSSVYTQGYDQGDVALIDTGIIEVEIIKEAGVFGVALFFLFLGLTIKQLDRLLSYSNEDAFTKITASTLLFAFFVYASLFYDATPIQYEVNYTPIMRSPIVLTILIVIGTLFVFDKEEAK